MSASAPEPWPEFGLTEAERREAVRGHWYEYPGMHGDRGEVWCYTDRLSYRPGETVRVHLSSTVARVDLTIGRDGATWQPQLTFTDIAAHWHDTPDQCSVTGCDWPDAHSFRIPDDWPSGGYRVTATIRGRGGKSLRCHHLFIVTPGHAAAEGRLLLVAATGTWTAYNTWGGSNHYQGITGAGRDQYAPVLSLERPFGYGFVVLPPDAPRIPLRFDPPPGSAPRYPHIEWARAHGYSKKYASAGWASYDSHFARWAERVGYRLDIVSQHELHYEPEILAGYRCIAVVGHDEYWTWEMRDAVDDFVDRGGRVARFAGNFMWQTRLEERGRRQICYKYRARAEDPVFGSDDPRRTTTSWEAPEVGRPGAATFGLNATRGLYAGWGGCAPRGVRGFPVYRPGHWAFAGTGLCYGDLLGAGSQIFGYEVDGVDYVIRNGLPYATGREGAPDGLEILALGMSSLMEERISVAADDQFLSDTDARFAATVLTGDDDVDGLDSVKRGCGMIVNFRRGRGEVFHAGSCEWVAGLLRRDPMVERVTRNVLDRYLAD